MPFNTPQPFLRDLLDQVHDGRIQLPDFQRPWKWDDERIVSLLATITRHYPVGVMMALETGDPRIRFKPRPLSGAPAATAKLEMLLMDGQQRLTSLYQALRSDVPVETMDARKKKLKRWYYIDIAKAVDDDIDREEAIVSVPEDRVLREDFGRGVTYDLTTLENEVAAGLFPFQSMLDNQKVMKWMFAFTAGDPRREQLWTEFITKVRDNVSQYQIPIITLSKDTPKEAVCTVFEKVNTGGVPLNVFELITASYAVDDFQLHEDWDRIWHDLDNSTMLVAAPHAGLSNTDFLQAVTLVSTYFSRKGRAACKRKEILDLPLEEYQKWSPQVVDALHWTAQFLRRQCVFNVGDIPYMTQLVALAAIRTVLGEEADTDEAYAKISRWYWCGVFGEQYGGSPETRLPRDLEAVVSWVREGQVPASVEEAIFREARLETMRSRNSAAYKGAYALLMQQGCKDWTYNRTPIDEKVYLDLKVDLYQIFPKGWCERNKIPRAKYESIVNKTLLTHRTGQLVGQKAPTVYLKSLETDTGLPSNWLDDILSTHLVRADLLRDEDFERFYQCRTELLRGLIEAAMGKRAIPAAEAPESADDYESDPELVA
ncbi:GmrSD restriction endonuclease domain-containing protein [Actinomadura nitritigenes]|uniref:GmrSD restriction endonuclease domain-containing protein n=1 Tax=Actinomadura nitritigenes TaxID=134602 RepID=UPI003D90472A